MAYPRRFIKITHGGRLQGTDEIYTVGYHYAGVDSAAATTVFNALTESDLENIHDTFTTEWNNPDNRIPAKWELEWTKAALIDTDGRYVPEFDAKEYIDLPVGGGFTGAYAPQLSCVVTLISAKPRDPGRYNRFYLPTAAISTADWEMTETVRSNIANNFADYFQSLNNYMQAVTPGAVVFLHVMSAKGAGQANEAVTLRVGSVIDTQRRRRNKLVENYSTVSLFP